MTRCGGCDSIESIGRVELVFDDSYAVFVDALCVLHLWYSRIVELEHFSTHSEVEGVLMQSVRCFEVL